MKLRSGRQYKNDLSDIVGVLLEHKKRMTPITYDQIKNAVCDLYGDWEVIPDISKELIESVMKSDNLEDVYQETVKSEREAKELLLNFQQDNPEAAKGADINSIINELKRRK